VRVRAAAAATAAMAAAYPETWKGFLEAPVFVISLARCEDRWETTRGRLADAGFMDVHRWDAVDASGDCGTEALTSGWLRHGTPKMDFSDQEFCISYRGKQGCMLSHLDLMAHAISERIPYFIVMEDDVLFHPQWPALAPAFYDATPKDYDLLYMGSQLEATSQYSIVRLPCFCTNAMAMTLAGAEKVYRFLLSQPRGVRTIDCMLKDHQTAIIAAVAAGTGAAGTRAAFEWYVWNGALFPTESAVMDKDWTKRNTGLVFQDVAFGSEVRPW